MSMDAVNASIYFFPTSLELSSARKNHPAAYHKLQAVNGSTIGEPPAGFLFKIFFWVTAAALSCLINSFARTMSCFWPVNTVSEFLWRHVINILTDIIFKTLSRRAAPAAYAQELYGDYAFYNCCRPFGL